MAIPHLSKTDIQDIQGFVLFGYRKLRYTRFVHVGLGPEGGRAFLSEILVEIHGALRHASDDRCRAHVAFTSAGLERLGLEDADLITFPREFRQGMDHDLRARVNGDDPKSWTFGTKRDPVHALLLLYAKTPDALDDLRGRIVARLVARGGHVVHEDHAELHDPGREHFGFRDGISQPHIAGSPHPTGPDCDEIPAGEFLLGHENAYSENPDVPRAGAERFPVGHNGTYLVYRKLAQDTAGFWKWMNEQPDPVRMASSLVGRWPSGAPLVRYPDGDPKTSEAAKESFLFAKEDPEGQKCPIGAHIRRANPRDMLPATPEESLRVASRHRLLRRGRPYGPPPPSDPHARAKEGAVDRGLIFIAINASIRRQFEFIQQTWINNPKFGGLYDESDPLVGTEPVAHTFTVPSDPLRKRFSFAQRFVTLEGGGYFFVPSLRALAWLAGAR